MVASESRIPGTCLFCGGLQRRSIASKDYNRRSSSARFDYLRCSRCGTYELGNIPADLQKYYPQDYYALPKNLDEADRSLAGDQYKLAMIQEHVRTGSLLEIGPGAGMFAHLAAKNGFAVETIEMPGPSARFIQDVLGIRTHQTDNEIAALAKCGPFDVIAMWHVIEHVRDPVKLLEASAARIAKGGILVLATPNPHALQFLLLRGRWAHLDAPRHLFLIPPRAVRAHAAALGLRELSVTTSDEGARYWNKFGWAVSLKNFIQDAYGARIAAKAGRGLAKLIRPIEAIPGLGSAYTMILRKE
jgi:2-polyprenyl-3-methyl-5-hydroxy-6-metoxy-1,4-benzoquinol methylase